jgi:hypothetical protein
MSHLTLDSQILGPSQRSHVRVAQNVLESKGQIALRCHAKAREWIFPQGEFTLERFLIPDDAGVFVPHPDDDFASLRTLVLPTRRDGAEVGSRAIKGPPFGVTLVRNFES